MNKNKVLKYFPIQITIFAAICFISAFLLTLEKIKVLADSEYIPSCDFSPLISCGSVMSTPQAAVFGFPNPLIGIIGFAIVITIGMGLIAGAKYKKWYWIGYYLGILFAISFVHWLIFQSVFRIGYLCPNCMVVWTFTWPLFYYSLLHGIKEEFLFSGKRAENIGNFLWNYRFLMIASWYVLVFSLIMIHFRDYFSQAIF